MVVKMYDVSFHYTLLQSLVECSVALQREIFQSCRDTYMTATSPSPLCQSLCRGRSFSAPCQHRPTLRPHRPAAVISDTSFHLIAPFRQPLTKKGIYFLSIKSVLLTGALRTARCCLSPLYFYRILSGRFLLRPRGRTSPRLACVS